MRLSRSRPDLDTIALRERIAELKSSQRLQDRRLEGVHVVAVLQPLLLGQPVLPLTGSALRPHCLTHIINDILINRRRRILEFGTGLSTILLARLFRHNGLDAHILSVDHDEHWVRAAAQLLEDEGLGDYVRIVCAPLGATELALDGNPWYDTAILGIGRARRWIRHGPHRRTPGLAGGHTTGVPVRMRASPARLFRA